MMRRLRIFFVCCGVLLSAGVSSADQYAFVKPATDDLTESLQVFRESLLKLESSNAELSRYNRDLKEHIEQGTAQLQSLNKNQDQPKAKADASKMEKKSSVLNAFEIQTDEVNDRRQNIEQEMAMKQLAMQESLRRQQVLWAQLAVAKDGNLAQLQERNEAAVKEINTEKTELTRRLEEARRRVNDMEAELSYQSALREDPAISLPKLSAQRDRLRQKLAALSSNAPVQKSAADLNVSKKLNFEVNGLAQQRSEKANLLQILESQYDKNEKITKNAAEEKKLQDAITALKKTNMLLLQQSADLKFEMVDLDKRKSYLEKIVSSAR